MALWCNVETRSLTVIQFQRVWVIQEAVKATEVFLRSGEQVLPWGTFIYAISELHNAQELLPPSIRQPIQNIKTMDVARLNRQQNKRRRLIDLYWEARKFRCTDERDRVFALLGMATDIGPEDEDVQPDYSCTLEDVLRRFTLFHLVHCEILDTLSWPNGTDNGSQNALPSWIPDARRFDDQEAFDHVPTRIDEKRAWFSASGNTKAQISLADDKKTLHVKGHILDCIQGIGRTVDEMIETPTHCDVKSALAVAECSGLEGLVWLDVAKLTAWLTECNAVASGGLETDIPQPSGIPSYYFFNMLGPPYFSLMNPLVSLVSHRCASYEAFWQTTTCGMSYRGRRVWYDSLYRCSYNTLLHLLHECTSVSEKWFINMWTRKGLPHRFMEQSIGVWSFGRRFCITRDGRFGCVPRSAAVGDLICIIHGGKTPYLIRPTADGRFRVLGECYVHGLMDGEGVKQTEIPARDIDLR